ncbi:MAG: cytochrome c [Bacteroidetes bacterium]|nr:MAG: cytochrome c [Bacteroidota bacterium]
MARWFCFMLIACIGVFCRSATAPQQSTVYTSAELEAGKQLFSSLCGNCHKINADMSGPALRGSLARWPNRALLYAFVRNSKSVVDTNAYAKGLYLAYNQTVMPAMPQLTDNQIDQIFAYVEANSQP